MSALALFLVYVFGGLTFLPLFVCCLFVHALIACPQKRIEEEDKGSGDTENTSTNPKNEELDPKILQSRLQSVDVAAGYFAITREFIAGGLSGRSFDRPPSSVQGVTAESPSVYQSMYRSVFERGKAQNPSIETEGVNSKHMGRVRNVFFVVLR